MSILELGCEMGRAHAAGALARLAEADRTAKEAAAAHGAVALLVRRFSWGTAGLPRSVGTSRTTSEFGMRMTDVFHGAY